MDAKSRKDLRAQYKERDVTGGVFVIKNIKTDKMLLDCAADIHGAKNRFDFCQKTGTCAYHKLQKDWAEAGGGQFTFETLEELTKGDNQTQAEFREDLRLLKDMWSEKLSGEILY